MKKNNIIFAQYYQFIIFQLLTQAISAFDKNYGVHFPLSISFREQAFRSIRPTQSNNSHTNPVHAYLLNTH